MNYINNQYINIENYILNDSNWPFVIAGRPGIGKSSLMAYVLEKVFLFQLYLNYNNDWKSLI